MELVAKPRSDQRGAEMTDNETIKSRGDIEQEEIDREDNADLVEKAKGIVDYEVANDQLRLWHLENTGGLLTEIHKAQTKLNLSLAHKAYFERHKPQPLMGGSLLPEFQCAG